MIEPAKIKGHYLLAWRMVKRLLFEQAHYVCEQCGITQNVELVVHHKDGCGLNNALDNLQVLCVNCHRKTERPHLTKREFEATGRKGRASRNDKEYIKSEYTKAHPRS